MQRGIEHVHLNAPHVRRGYRQDKRKKMDGTRREKDGRDGERVVEGWKREGKERNRQV
jgi:hypothetical protein